MKAFRFGLCCICCLTSGFLIGYTEGRVATIQEAQPVITSWKSTSEQWQAIAEKWEANSNERESASRKWETTSGRFEDDAKRCLGRISQ